MEIEHKRVRQIEIYAIKKIKEDRLWNEDYEAVLECDIALKSLNKKENG